MKYLEGITPREYQQKIFEACIKKNCLVVLPTGLGKTLIALMLTIERMTKHPGQKVLFLAPTKPLAEQHLAYFKKYLPELFGDMQLFTGQVNAKERKKIWKTADIIFSTPQCIANDVKKMNYKMDEVCLLIEDECHRCVKNYDYNFIAKKYMSQSINPRILGLTASPGSDIRKIKEICRNLSIEDVEMRTRESPDVKEYLQELEFEKRLVKFPAEFLEIKLLLEKIFYKYVSELKHRRLLFGPVSKIALIKLQQKLIRDIGKNRDLNNLLGVSTCAQAIKIQHALEVLETQTLYGFINYMKGLFEQASKKQSKGVIKLVKKPEFNLAYLKANEIVSRKQEHPKLGELKKIIEEEKGKNENFKAIVFSQFRDTAQAISETLNDLEGINAKVFVGQAKKRGVGLNQKEQKRIVTEFREGIINILCATCIAEEGLDIPEVNAVVFYEPIPSAIRSIQRRGRTARLAKGKLIILITEKTRDEAHYFISRAREKQMEKSIETVKKDLGQKKLF